MVTQITRKYDDITIHNNRSARINTFRTSSYSTIPYMVYSNTRVL